ncbi:MAG: hypothetical protein ACPGXY_05560 [Alphaproteobacteria bacterium]
MFKTLKLLLPALIPSWNFFDIIAPSPRIEFTLLKTSVEPPAQWQEFRPHPEYIPPLTMFKSLFWNPWWNENLFLVSCAERLLENPTEHSRQEITSCIKADLKQNDSDFTSKPYCQFRLVLLTRNSLKREKQVAYVSPTFSLAQEDE